MKRMRKAPFSFFISDFFCSLCGKEDDLSLHLGALAQKSRIHFYCNRATFQKC